MVPTEPERAAGARESREKKIGPYLAQTVSLRSLSDSDLCSLADSPALVLVMRSLCAVF